IVPRTLHESLGIHDWSWVTSFVGDGGAASLFAMQQEYRRDCSYYTASELEASQAGQHSRANFYKWIRATFERRHLLGSLANRGVFPKYGFPVDVVSLEIPPEAISKIERTGAPGQLENFGLELSRDLKLAISEY